MKASRRTSSLDRCILETLESRQMMAAGDLDLTFGSGGKVISERVGFPVADIAVQRDGKIIAVGELNNDFAVARLNTNGTLDKPFGGNNTINTGIAFADFGGDRGDFANSVAIQSDGKIVVGGHMDDTSFTTLADTGGFAIARFNIDGSLDKTFDGDGKLTIDMPGVEESFVSAVAIQPDGKILAAGRAGTRGRFAPPTSDQQDFAIARLMPNGKLDNTFGSALGINNLRSGKLTIGFGNDDDEGAKAISLAPDGKIVVGGVGGLGTSRFAVARLNSNGTLDSSFGDGISGAGRFNNLLLGTNFKDMHVSADGSVTIVGGINGNFLTVRLTSSGRLDRSFNGNGRVETDLGANDDAKHTFVNREGITVAGGSSGKFAMVRYRLNGELDQSFGQGGKVITPVGANDAILTSVQTPDGKLLAYGRSGSVARYFSALPKVNVFSLDPDGAEGGNNPASLIFTRDIRASFTTRIFFDLGGTATFGTDYTGPTPAPSANTRGGLVFQSIPFVDIPAGETTAIVPINVIDDKVLEPTETVLTTIRASAAYTLGNRTTQQLDIADNDIARVNFQVTPSPFAFAFEPDLGLPFAARPNGQQFGWDVDNKANARDRGFAAAPGMSLIYTTFNHMQKPVGARQWEIALPNGMYQVKLAAGDPKNVDSVYKMNLEGQLALSGTPANRVRWFERTVNVQVSDGRLTLSNAVGAVNNKIAFLEIKSAAPAASAGPVTDNVPVSLPIQPLGTLNPPNGGTIFSQMQI